MQNRLSVAASQPSKGAKVEQSKQMKNEDNELVDMIHFMDLKLSK